MLRRTKSAAILRALLALCLAWPAAPSGDRAGLGVGSTSPARELGGPAHRSTPQLQARSGHDGPAVAATPDPEDRDVEDADGPDAPRRPAAALLPALAAAWPAAVLLGAAPTRSAAARTPPSPRLIAIRC